MILKLILLFIIMAMLFILRRQSLKPSVRSRDNKYHAVEIHAGASSCDRARTLDGECILSSEFNSRVLRQCDRANCTCNFRHFTDRRQGLERRLKRTVHVLQQHSYGRRTSDIHNRARFRLAKDKSTSRSLAGTV